MPMQHYRFQARNERGELTSGVLQAESVAEAAQALRARGDHVVQLVPMAAAGEDFKAYQHQIVLNAKALAAALAGKGLRLVSGGTDNHMMLINLTGTGRTGKELENLLVRANAELRADFDFDAFEHLALWNEAESRMEMHLRSIRDQRVTIGETVIAFAKGETIHTESSRKFTRASIAELTEAAGWTVLLFEQSSAPSVALALLGA